MGSNSFQNDLWSSAEQMELILSNLHTGVLIIDQETHLVLEANERVCELSGRSKNDILGKDCQEVLCSASYDQCPAQNKALERATAECVLKSKNGAAVPILKTVTRIELGGRKCVLESIVDLTEQKNVENRLREERERVEELARIAEEANKAKSEFLANISHELRTPLNGVIGMAGLLKETTLTEDQECYADTMYTCAESLLKLVNGVLDYSSLEAGNIELTNRVFSPKHLAESVAELVKGPIRKKALTFSLQVDKDVFPVLQGDPSRLQQVLMILVDNAIKFTHEGGIAIRLSQREEDVWNSRLRFSVSDTGIGVPDDMHQHVFERFTQVDSSTTRRYGGTGLGLATAKQIVQLMDGKIGLKNRKGGGTRFWFEVTLPKKLASTIAPVDMAREEKKSILVVDDSATNAAVMKSILERLGFAADTAGGGERAIEMLSETSYDLVFMDLQMPDMSGVITTKAIRAGLAGDEMEDVPIVALSASVISAGEGWREAGMNARLKKPVMPDDLAAFLDEMFEELTGQHETVKEFDSAVESENAAQWNALRVLDHEKLKQRLMGDEAILKTVLKGFIGDMPGQIDQLDQLIQSRELGAARIRAHGIKGASATVCADRMSAHCARMEQFAELGDLFSLKEEMDTLRHLYDELKQLTAVHVQ
ncbi:MAG: response regulator [Deltaproteobacteria bacterium]|nr:response regulator [Deltaproteobacteria bacterium]MBN2671210.1 response regulator [Deltaproteobacteria bacterium]